MTEPNSESYSSLEPFSLITRILISLMSAFRLCRIFNTSFCMQEPYFSYSSGLSLLRAYLIRCSTQFFISESFSSSMFFVTEVIFSIFRTMYTFSIRTSTGVDCRDFHGMSISKEPICEYLIENGMFLSFSIWLIFSCLSAMSWKFIFPDQKVSSRF